MRPTVASAVFCLAGFLANAQNPSATSQGRNQEAAARNAHSGFVEVDGSRLHFDECGTGSDAVVLLHDGVVDSAVWDDVWPAFCGRFHTVRYDRRGYGRSPATKKPYFEADDLAALLQDRKIDHVDLVASSHGGQVALEFALRYGGFVRGLVLVGPGVSGFPYSEHFIMRDRSNSQTDKVPEFDRRLGSRSISYRAGP